MDWQTIIAVVGGATGVLGVVVSWVTARASARKSSVEAQAVIIANLREGYDRICAENAILRSQIDELRGEYNELTERYTKLRADYLELATWAGRRGWPGGIQR